jgi:alpha-L-rhamnosidase
MNSLNHYAYGSIVEWMYRDMCGLNPAAGGSPTGFRHAVIAPKPHPSLRWAKARYRSAAGTYASGWRYDEHGQITYEITIPFNATAAVTLPDAHLSAVRLNGQPPQNAEQIDTRVTLTLGAGTHTITYPVRANAAVAGTV